MSAKRLVLLVLTCLAGACANAQNSRVVMLQAPVSSWDEGLPLGNGLLGGLLWGSENTINLSLDRGDLWDLRVPLEFSRPNWNYKTLVEAVAAGNDKLVNELTDDSYNHPWPTKLPCGRLIIRAPADFQAQSFALDLSRAQATVKGSNSEISAWIDANEPIIQMRIPMGSRMELQPPAALSTLGYPRARRSGFGDSKWFLQDGVGNLQYAVVMSSKPDRGKLHVALTIEAGRTSDVLERARRRLRAALAKPSVHETEHLRWWSRFWRVSDVSIPDARLQLQYNFVKYLYGAGSRRGAPAIPLQGVWTADNGQLPPWKGDFHNDLNTQMTYVAYPAAGLFDQGRCWLDMNTRNLPRYREFASRFYGVRGAVVPGVMDLEGKPLGGWGQYSFSPTNGAWIADQFFRHWRYTLDRSFLKDQAYPFCSEIGRALVALIDDDGKLKLSTSPEIGDNSARAWLTPNSNYDQALITKLFDDLVLMAKSLELHSDETTWRTWRMKCAPLVTDDTGALAFAAGLPYNESHRHFSHAMAIHPLNLVTHRSSERDRSIIDATIRSMLKAGTAWWTGYSFSWFACMLATAGDGDGALKYLQDYNRAFTLRNGFHCNGDQSGEGLSNFTYRPFTLEGNFLAMEAIQTMLLNNQEGCLHVFPAVPAKWKDVSYQDLHAEGALTVSAVRTDGHTAQVKVRSLRGGVLRLEDPFGGKGTWSDEPRRAGSVLEWSLSPGKFLVGRL